MLNATLSDNQLDQLFAWIDTIPLSRPKKNINRDFSDALLMAETVNQFYPKLIQLHNYPPTNSIKNKLANWKTLHHKALGRLGINLKVEELQKLASATPLVVESLLYEFKKICESDGLHSITAVKKKTQQKQFPSPRYDQQQNNPYQVKKMTKAMEGMQVSKTEELREILKLIKQKIVSTQRIIRRKDAEIKELEDIIKLGV